MKTLLLLIIKSTKGSFVSEYALAMAGIGVVTIAALTALGDEIKAAFELVLAALQ